MGATEQVNELLRAEYRRLIDQHSETISPARLAGSIFQVLDPRHAAPDLVQFVALLGLKQMARAICRAGFEQQQNPTAPEQEPLFTDDLQPYYPATRDDNEVYVVRERLTYEERLILIARLRAEGLAKLKHASALEAETEKLINSGKLKRPE